MIQKPTFSFRPGLAVLTLLALSSLASCTKKEPAAKQPNIIYIYTDQQSATMMSAAGNKYLKTPAMDYIADNGIRFTRAYAPNPVCAPSRLSLMTGRMPSYFTNGKGEPLRENGEAMRIPEPSEEVVDNTIAAHLKRAGYDLFYGGKEHLSRHLTPAKLGFTMITKNERDDLAARAAEVINADHEKPYFMMVSLINPHDICYMAIRDFDPDNNNLKDGLTELATLDEALKKPAGVSDEEFFAKYLPPLPPNFEPQADEPKAIEALLELRDFRIKARRGYSEEQWRMHRYAYCRLTEMVDEQIQVILDALKASGKEEETLILFSSDHGDMDAAHRMEHKTVLYEESANIPFMAMWKGQIPAGQVDDTHLVSNGLDLLPTLGDYAGIEAQVDPRGRSLRPLFENKKTEWRKYLGVESEIGRMIVSEDKLKFIRYDFVGIEEQLLDLKNDLHETRHFTDEASHAQQLAAMKKAYGEWFGQ